MSERPRLRQPERRQSGQTNLKIDQAKVIGGSKVRFNRPIPRNNSGQDCACSLI